MGKKKPEYEFLKRRPRIFKVGNPRELGFRVDDYPVVDKHGIEWSDAIHTVAALIFANENIPTGLEPRWFGDVFYWIESPYPFVRFDDQGYAEFARLRDKAIMGSPDELFRYSPPVETYAIPPADTPEREQFTRIVKLWSNLTKRHYEALRQIRDGVEVIKSILSEHGAW